MKLRQYIILLNVITLLLFLSLGQGYEVDNFTFRYQTEKLKDSLEILDKEVNSRISKAINKMNSSKITRDKCDKEEFVSVMYNQIAGNLIGSIEEFADKSPQITRHSISSRQSIYTDQSRNIEKSSNSKRHSKQQEKHKTEEIRDFGIVLGFLSKFAGADENVMSAVKSEWRSIVGVQSNVLVNGVYVGADKFGHFFDQGYEYYRKMKKTKSLQNSLDYGVQLEEGMYGLSSTGIKSYGDLVANYNGLKFWQEIVDARNPLVACSDGKWFVKRPFTFANFVDFGWDEGINCSEFDSALRKTFLANIRSLKRKNPGMEFNCPISSKACESLVKKYEAVAKYILSPKCSKIVGDETKAESEVQ